MKLVIEYPNDECVNSFEFFFIRIYLPLFQNFIQ